MTAAVDGELSPGRRSALDRHLAGCPVCRGEQAASERILGVLDALPMAASVPERLEQATLRRVRVLAAEEDERAARRWWRGWVPLPAVAIAAMATLVLAIAITRRGTDIGPARLESAPARQRVARAVPPSAPAPEARVRRVPPAEPPPELAAAPELFVDLPLLRNLDKVKHFEAIQTTTLDDETPSGEEAPSDG